MNNFNNIWRILNTRFKTQLYIFYFIVGFFILSVVIWDIFSSKIVIKIAPYSSKITINNQPIKNGKIKVLPGKYKIKAEKEDFKTQEIEIEVKILETKQVEFFLEQLDGSTSWYEHNLEDDLIKTAIGDRIFAEKDSQLRKNNPILEFIPVSDQSISGSYRIDPEIKTENNQDKVTGIIITINDCRVRPNYNPFEFQKTAALNWLMQKNINLDDYEIKYVNSCVIGQ